MGASQSMEKLDSSVYVALNDTLTSGVTKVDPSQPISEILFFNVENREATLYLQVNGLSVASASSAAKGWGEHVFSYPAGLGLIQPLYSSVKITSTTNAAQTATAGEVGLGSLISSGTNATVGAVGATAENIMEGTTIANHVAATALTIEEANGPLAFGDHGAVGIYGVLDATSAAVKCHLNFATTYGQASTAATVFSGTIVHRFRVLSSGYGVL